MSTFFSKTDMSLVLKLSHISFQIPFQLIQANCDGKDLFIDRNTIGRSQKSKPVSKQDCMEQKSH